VNYPPRSELEWWEWFLRVHLPFTQREEYVGYRYCEGRPMMLGCGLSGDALHATFQGDVLDLGSGAISVLECRRGCRTIAVDPLMGEFARKFPALVKLGWKYNGVTYLQSTVADLLDESFDVVWCYNVLDHIPEWREALAGCRRVLRPGGLLILGTDVRYPDYKMSGLELDLHPSAFTAEDVYAELDKNDMLADWVGSPGHGPKWRLGLRTRRRE